MPFHVPEQYRIKNGPMGSTSEYGNNGAFRVPVKGNRPGFTNKIINVVASDQLGWEHCSVSLPHRTPTWDEMSQIKRMFWGDDDCVVQFHPPKSEYINNHPYCLHLWKPIGTQIPTPNIILV